MEENKYYLYRHIRLDSGVPFYIGIGTKPDKYNTYEGEYSRAFSKSNRNRYWKNIVSKHGYKVDILFECGDRKIIEEKEVEFIKLYGRVDLGKGTLVNLTDGGEGVPNLNEETKSFIKQKLIDTSKDPKIIKQRSDRMSLNWKNSNFRDKMSKKLNERNLDSEFKKKQSENAKIRCSNEDYLRGLSERTRLQWQDAEYKKEMTKRFSEQWLNDDYRTKVITKSKQTKSTPEYKNKIKLIMSELKGVLVVDKETGIFYNSLPSACEAVNISYKLEKSRFDRGSKLARFIRAND